MPKVEQRVGGFLDVRTAAEPSPGVGALADRLAPLLKDAALSSIELNRVFREVVRHSAAPGGWRAVARLRRALRRRLPRMTATAVHPSREDVFAGVASAVSGLLGAPAAAHPDFWTSRRAAWHEALGAAGLLDAPRPTPDAVVPTEGGPSEAVGSTAQPILLVIGPPGGWWRPIGPFSTYTSDQRLQSGRVVSIAFSGDGARVYAASANGGVFRSDDLGRTFRSVSDDWDQNPTGIAGVDSLACGAIAVHPSNPDRVYVGTGEGDTWYIRGNRAATGVPMDFAGIGPIVSSDGGGTWQVEPVADATGKLVSLAGQAFYELAVDAFDGEHVLAATTNGLYERTVSLVIRPTGPSTRVRWRLRLPGSFTSVKAVTPFLQRTRWVAAQADGSVWTSTNGSQWTVIRAAVGGSGRYRLATAPAATAAQDVLYLLDQWGGLVRRDPLSNAWVSVSGVPSGSPSPWNPYNLAIALGADGTVYLGNVGLRACTVTATVAADGRSTTYAMTSRNIGMSLHADLHALTFRPGDPNSLWVGCDGGVYVQGGGQGFSPRNVGLANLQPTRIGFHPRWPTICIAGTQDNGGQMWRGEALWDHVMGGDGGAVVFHRSDPRRVLVTYVWYPPFSLVTYSSDGGRTFVGTTNTTDAGTLFYPPLEACPPAASGADTSGTVALGGTQVWVTDNFQSGHTAASLVLSGTTSALAFASRDQLYVGTTTGAVYRLNRASPAWTGRAIHPTRKVGKFTVRAPSPWAPLSWVTAIAVDPSDASGASVYVAFGGAGDPRHVWHYDGTTWSDRSGPSTGVAGRLLDVSANALLAVPQVNGDVHLYVGTDIGVWFSEDGGRNWLPLARGLPDAAVVDLVYHPVSRAVYAALHGRGVYELRDSPMPQADVHLYLRANMLDIDRRWPTDGQVDPHTSKAVDLIHSPDLKIDAPTVWGVRQTEAPEPHHYTFRRVTDGSAQVPIVAQEGAPPLRSRVYVQVHNYGPKATTVRVLLLASPPALVQQVMFGTVRMSQIPGARPLDGARVREVLRALFTPAVGAPLSSGADAQEDWRFVGRVVIADVRTDRPRIAAFEMGAGVLPSLEEVAGTSLGGRRWLVAIVDSDADPFTDPGGPVTHVVQRDRHVAILEHHCKLVTVPTGLGQARSAPVDLDTW